MLPKPTTTTETIKQPTKKVKSQDALSKENRRNETYEENVFYILVFSFLGFKIVIKKARAPKNGDTTSIYHFVKWLLISKGTITFIPPTGDGNNSDNNQRMTVKAMKEYLINNKFIKIEIFKNGSKCMDLHTLVWKKINKMFKHDKTKCLTLCQLLTEYLRNIKTKTVEINLDFIRNLIEQNSIGISEDNHSINCLKCYFYELASIFQVHEFPDPKEMEEIQPESTIIPNQFVQTDVHQDNSIVEEVKEKKESNIVTNELIQQIDYTSHEFDSSIPMEEDNRIKEDEIECYDYGNEMKQEETKLSDEVSNKNSITIEIDLDMDAHWNEFNEFHNFLKQFH